MTQCSSKTNKIMNQEQRDILEAAFGTLPTKEGYELVGVENITPKIGDTFFGSEWTLVALMDFSYKLPTAIFKKLEPKPKPTTIHDLMPEGNENVYIHDESESWAADVLVFDDGLWISKNPIVECKQVGWRWSYSIHTPYEEANEFVV